MFDEIYLETDEEVTSAIEKIKRSKKTNVALILPRNAILGQSIINLKLIFKQATQMKKTLGIVSPDKVTRSLAEKVGFGVADSTKDIVFPTPRVEDNETKEPPTKEEAEPEVKNQESEINDPANEADLAEAGFSKQKVGTTKETTDAEPESLEEFESTDGPDVLEVEDSAHVTPDREDEINQPKSADRSPSMIPTRGNLRMYRQAKRRPLWRILTTVVSLIVVALIVAGLLVPKATVAITVVALPFNESVIMKANTEATAVNVETATMPAKKATIEETTKSSSKATGKKDIGSKAKGQVTLENSWDSLPHTFEAGTTLRAKNGNEYKLTEAVTVPGATSTISAGQIAVTPGKKTGSVEAAGAGDAYNIAPTTFTIPNLPKAQQEKIFASSGAAFTGGTSQIVTVVTQDDIDKLSESVKTKNKEDGIARLKEANQDSVVLESAIKIVAQDVTTSVNVDAQSEGLEVTVKGNFEVIVFSKQDQNELVSKLIANKIPQGQVLAKEGDGVGLDATQLEVSGITEKEIELTNNIKTFTITQFNELAVRRSLAGIGKGDLQKALANQVETKNVEASVTPSWWPRMPFLSGNISIEYRYAPKDS